ncbi:MAG: type II toxin-antitoxin system RelE/ParE family toxin [Algicola sp.]|nr:type II toxin-antitoxin system RelE/ParE family toxin [Algicola sp.]
MNCFEVKLTPKAEDDLAEILSYIAEDNLENAVNFVDKLIVKINDTLSIMPYSGTLFGEVRGNQVRTFVLHKSYTAFYRIVEDKEQVEEISVFNTYQDDKAFWLELKSQGITPQ